MLALKNRVRVVPIGTSGATHVLPYATLIPKPTLKRVRVHFGKPIDFSDLQGVPRREARAEATRRIEEGMRAAIAVARS
jgi:1-acyl-sn-glycerol-3-phosphate acyltransferase